MVNRFPLRKARLSDEGFWVSRSLSPFASACIRFLTATVALECEGVRPHLVPRVNPPVYECRVGEALDLLNFLISKLPAPIDEDLSKGILDAIDMDSYRVEKQAARRIQLQDEDASIEPVPTTGGGRSRNRNWIGCRTSPRLSTTCSGTSRGPTAIGCTS